MIDVKLIKDLKENKSKSMREIARITGHNFRTVKKYVEMQDFSETPKVKKLKPSKLAPFYSTIESWLKNRQTTFKETTTYIPAHT